LQEENTVIRGLTDWTNAYGFMVRIEDNGESCTYRHTFKTPISRDDAINLRDMFDQGRDVMLSKVYVRQHSDNFI
jgi:hypothetical protein